MRELFCLFFGRDREPNFASLDFFKGNACEFMFVRINIKPRTRAALKLFAALSRNDNHAVLRIHLRLFLLFLRLFASGFDGFRHFRFCTPENESIEFSDHCVAEWFINSWESGENPLGDPRLAQRARSLRIDDCCQLLRSAFGFIVNDNVIEFAVMFDFAARIAQT